LEEEEEEEEEKVERKSIQESLSLPEEEGFP